MKKRSFFNTIISIITIIIGIIWAYYPSISYKSITSMVTNLNDDFFLNVAHHELFKTAISKYGIFPFWSHFIGGGYPTIGHPFGIELSPFVVITLLFDSITAVKMIPVIILILSGISIYFFSKNCLHYTNVGALYVALATSLNQFLAIRIWDGNPNEALVALAPVALFIFWKIFSDGKIKKRYILLLSLVFYTSGLSLFLILSILFPLTIIELFNPNKIFEISNTKRWLPITVLSITVCFTLLFGAHFYLPLYQLLKLHGGVTNLQTIAHLPIYIPDFSIVAPTLNFLLKDFFWKQLGFVPITLLLLTLVFYFKKISSWIILTLFFSWLILAYNAPIDLMRLLHLFPAFNYINDTGKFLGYQLTLVVVIASGQMFSHDVKKITSIGFFLLALIGITNLLLKTRDYQDNTYNFYFPKASDLSAEILNQSQLLSLKNTENNFFQIKALNSPRARVTPINGLTYFNILRNIGTIDWYSGLALKEGEHAIAKYFVTTDNIFIPNPLYIGEIYCEGKDFKAGNKKIDITFLFNTIKIKFKNPDAKDLTQISSCNWIINQNYNKDWSTPIGKLINKNGLLALKLSDQEINYLIIKNANNLTINLKFVPHLFYIGLAISLSAICLFLIYCFFQKKECYKNKLSFTF
ncbi:MAG: hypothetical protein HQK49_10565 [Oligoflexia bacterium]|nr:hypothetical protein [Oligoflexia bacterium]